MQRRDCARSRQHAGRPTCRCFRGWMEQRAKAAASPRPQAGVTLDSTGHAGRPWCRFFRGFMVPRRGTNPLFLCVYFCPSLPASTLNTWRYLSILVLRCPRVSTSLGWIFGWMGRRSIGREGQAAGLADEAWKSVATTIRAGGMPRDDNDVADTATGVAFTERLLRELLPLEPGQQIANRRRMTAPGCRRSRRTRGRLLPQHYGRKACHVMLMLWQRVPQLWHSPK